MNEDKYDKKSWAGVFPFIIPKKWNPFNRAAAGHDSCYERKELSQDRCDEEFEKRMKVYQWLYSDQPKHKWLRRFCAGTVGAVGWIFYNT